MLSSALELCPIPARLGLFIWLVFIYLGDGAIAHNHKLQYRTTNVIN